MKQFLVKIFFGSPIKGEAIDYSLTSKPVMPEGILITFKEWHDRNGIIY